MGYYPLQNSNEVEHNQSLGRGKGMTLVSNQACYEQRGQAGFHQGNRKPLNNNLSETISIQQNVKLSGQNNDEAKLKSLQHGPNAQAELILRHRKRLEHLLLDNDNDIYVRPDPEGERQYFDSKAELATVHTKNFLVDGINQKNSFVSTNTWFRKLVH